MGDLQHLAKFVREGRLLQLATTSGNQPWVCTVYFVADKSLRLYWLSYPIRRHSQELAANSKAAIAIVVKPDLPVIGVQAEGTVEVVNDPAVVETVMKTYVAKYSQGQQFYDNFTRGINKHELYCFVPTRYGIFDEYHTD